LSHYCFQFFVFPFSDLGIFLSAGIIRKSSSSAIKDFYVRGRVRALMKLWIGSAKEQIINPK